MNSVSPVFPEAQIQPERIAYAKMVERGEITVDQYLAMCALLDKDYAYFNLLTSRP
jgi:hypothetical protein